MVKDSALHYKTPQQIKEFQEARLKEALQYVAENSPFSTRETLLNNS